MMLDKEFLDLLRRKQICTHQFVHLHQLLLLLMQLVVLDLQHHLQTLQLLLQVHGVRVLLHKQHRHSR